MAQVVTFVDYTPTPRFDATPWTDVEIQEGTTDDGPWVTLETVTLSPVDADPENPATRSFTTELASDALDLWYRLLFIDGSGDEQQPSLPIQNVLTPSYASANELARILKIRTPSDEQRAAMRRVLSAAAGEINAEIDLAATTFLTSWQVALAAEVNLERAVEHWRQQESPFGLIGLGGELGGAERTARDSWDRHAHKLAPLKGQWGLA